MIKFGTDGVRGDSSVVNPEFAYNLGRGVSTIVEDGATVPTGGDTRESTFILIEAFQAGLRDGGVQAEYMGVTTTPAIAHESQRCGKYSAVVTASHNPYMDNGIKIFAPGGYKIDDDTSEHLEYFLNDGRHQYQGQMAEYPLAQQLLDNYEEYLAASLDNPNGLGDMRIVFDGANGAGYAVGPRVLRRFGADVITMACEPNGRNINEGCGANDKHKTALIEKVLASKADAGMTIDGDGDRVMLITESSRILDGDRIMYILAASAKARGEQVDKVVGTIMSNLGFGKALNNLGIKLVRAKVGDKYVTAALDAEGLSIGGEQAGHIILTKYAPSGDGILSGAKTLEAIRASGKSADEWADEMTDYPQTLLNLKNVDPKHIENSNVQSVIAEVANELDEPDTLNVRGSGTEPLVRVMVQSSRFDQGKVEEFAARIGEALRSAA